VSFSAGHCGIERPPLVRPVADRWIGGVAAGVARHLEQPVTRVRWAFVVLTLLGGAGALAYLLLWALVPSVGGVAASPSRRGAGSGAQERPPAAEDSSAALQWRAQGPQLMLGAGLLAVGIALLAQRAGMAVSPVTVAAVVVLTGGVMLAWGQLDAAERSRWLASAGGDTRPGLIRLGAGVALAVVGIVLLVSGQVDARAVRSAVVAAGAVLLGVGLLVAPWVLRLGRELVAERSARIRETERAEIAAHLHDSVLQTLALIQRRSGDPAEVNRLARAQERQLREWLYSSPAEGEDGDAAAGLTSAVRAAVADVEDLHAVAVDVVTVGDARLDGDTRAVVLALREAVLNAVRHGAPPVSVYVEAEPGRVEAFVRDHGAGVDVDEIPADRLGVRESVLGRMERHGGRAVLRRAPGGGTEVALSLGVLDRVGNGGEGGS
jgi:signal transduction histidine kinase/phage shock protein PspC (stress-responsive transcriptional regulator)